MNCVKIQLHGGSSHVVAAGVDVLESIGAELDALKECGAITLTFTHVEMTREELESLSEFMGH